MRNSIHLMCPMRNVIIIFFANLSRRDYVKVLVINETIILNFVLEKRVFM